jgi:hypothetical protein
MTIDQAVATLETAFPPTPLHPERAFAEWGTTYVDHQTFEDESRGKTWTQLSSKFLEFHHDALAYLGPEGLVAYVPAYLKAVLIDDGALDLLPTFLFMTLRRSKTRDFEARFARFSGAQRKAIAAVLVTLEHKFDGLRRKEPITEALDEYWRTINRSGT